MKEVIYEKLFRVFLKFFVQINATPMCEVIFLKTI